MAKPILDCNLNNPPPNVDRSVSRSIARSTVSPIQYMMISSAYIYTDPEGTEDRSFVNNTNSVSVLKPIVVGSPSLQITNPTLHHLAQKHKDSFSSTD